MSDKSYVDIIESFKKYKVYLESKKDFMSQHIFEVFNSDWYYDAKNHKCPHDSSLNRILVANLENSKNSIKIELLGAYRDIKISYFYTGVTRYSIETKFGAGQDWDRDEIEVTACGINHKIVWTNGDFWEIESSHGPLLEFETYEIPKLI